MHLIWSEQYVWSSKWIVLDGMLIKSHRSPKWAQKVLCAANPTSIDILRLRQMVASLQTTSSTLNVFNENYCILIEISVKCVP